MTALTAAADASTLSHLVAPRNTPWIDAWVRWERSAEGENGDDDDDEAPPVPTRTFTASYQLSSDTSTTLTLQGFPLDSEQIWNSTGLTIWPSASILCDYLLDHQQALFGRTRQPQSKELAFTFKQTVIELGSGLGQCGLLIYHLLVSLQQQRQDCCSLGDCRVLLTDGDTDTLAQLGANIQSNPPPSLPATTETATTETTSRTTKNETTNSSPCHISCHQLLWGTAGTQQFLTHYCRGLSAPNNKLLVLGSDLIYVPQNIPPLFETVHCLLLSSKSSSHDPDDEAEESPIFLMAHSDRREGSSVTLDMVLAGAERAGFSHRIVAAHEPKGIYVMEFRLLGPGSIS